MARMKRKQRRKEQPGKLELEKVIGLTTTNSSGFASNFATGDFVYLAGCVVVVYNVNLNCQVRFLMAPRTPKPLTCVAYSHFGGKFIVAGESGHQPAVIIWDSYTGSCIADLKAHKYGVSCVEFSPNGKHLVSVGFPHDGFLCLWDWKSGMLVSKIRATTAVSPIASVHFSSDGNFFLTAGVKHLKQWTLGVHAGCRVTAGIGTLAIDCKPVNLGSQKESSFVSVSSASYFECSPVSATQSIEMLQSIYVLTAAGILCLLQSGVAIKKWVNLKVQQSYGLAVSDSHVACACSNGVVRLLMKETLVYAGTLPKPEPCGSQGLTNGNAHATFCAAHNASVLNFPDAIACSFSASQKLAVIYSDHSLYVWDVHNLSQITRCCAFLSHSACIWDIATLPSCQKLRSISCPHYGGDGSTAGAFVTCSADGTIRLWDLTLKADIKEPHSEDAVLHSKTDNLFCKDVLGVIYSDRRGESPEKQVGSEEPVDLARGFRSLAVSADGVYLAAGDSSGNLHVYDLSTLDLLSFQEAHDAEILTLNFSNAREVKSAENGSKDHCFLASGGRDRLIHIYDVNRDFDVIETLEDHSASITTVKFACNSLKLLSCSADKSVVFRSIVKTDSGCTSNRYHQEVASRGTVYDMDIEPGHKLAVTVGQDKKINVFSLDTGRPVRTFKQDVNVGEPIKVRVDQSGSFLVCSHADKCIRIYDFTSGELVAQSSGHAEVITGAIFLADCKRLISVSGDSCIFVWKLPPLLSKVMRKKCIVNSNSCSYCKLSIQKSQAEDDSNILVAVSDTPRASGLSEPLAFKFSVSRLPKWAQTKVVDGKLPSVKQDEKNIQADNFHSVDSRWTERLGDDGYHLFVGNKTPPATIRRRHFGVHLPFTEEEQRTCSDSTSECSFGSLIGKSPACSKSQQREDTQWRTVHTVVFYENEFLQNDNAGGNGPTHATANMDNIEQRADVDVDIYPQAVNFPPDPSTSHELLSSAECANANADLRADSPMLQYRTPLKIVCNNTDGEDICNGISKVRCSDQAEACIQTSRVSRSTSWDNLQSTNKKMFMTEASSGEDETDEFFDNKDIFRTHFGSLSTAIKLETGTASARSSFSTRYFAQTSSITQMALFQTSPKGEVVHGTPTICNHTVPVTLPTSEHTTNVQNNANLNVGKHDTEVFDSSVHKSVNLNSQLCSLPSMDMKDSLVNLDVEIKDNIQGNSEQQDDEMTLKKDLRTENEIRTPSIIALSECNGDPDQYCAPSCREPSRILDVSRGIQNHSLTSFSCTINQASSLNHFPQLFYHSLGQRQQGSTVDTDDIREDGGESDCLVHKPDLPEKSEKEAVKDMQRSPEEYKQALKTLSDAAENALSLFTELGLEDRSNAELICVKSSSDLLDFAERILPTTLEKVHRLCNLALSDQLYEKRENTFSCSISTEAGEKPSLHSSIDGQQSPRSRECMSASVAPSEITLPSVDLEAFIQHYSERLSESLSSQVLAMIQKGLS